ncbi:MAG TPA: DNA/RNA non-specific endonuclease [Candidatus Rifleibacterium sp.]|nr:DNA/RNA non-specific endonuclease [Candidatus Rifleibacterium sp.]HPT46026.1 DNA/RNA non-specific endonuclease [Candidatus Rifleibacterium sp.]
MNGMAVKNRRGALGPTQLIAIILLLTAIGIGIYYYLQYRQSKVVKPPRPASAPAGFFPVDKALRQATLQTGNIVYGGNPITASSTRLTILKNLAYHTGYSDERRNPIWAAYRLDTDNSSDTFKRPKGFKVDLRTSARITPSDYVKSGYDRGHMAPNSAIAERYGLDAQLETFLMSNIVPQAPVLNRQVWQRLERLEDEYSNILENVWVITGPVFDDHIQLMNKDIEVPDAFFKIIFDEQQDNVRALAFLIQQDVTGKEPIDSFLTSIDEIEKLTGLDFIAPLADDIENSLEAATPGRLWQ